MFILFFFTDPFLCLQLPRPSRRRTSPTPQILWWWLLGKWLLWFLQGASPTSPARWLPGVRILLRQILQESAPKPADIQTTPAPRNQSGGTFIFLNLKKNNTRHNLPQKSIVDYLFSSKICQEFMLPFVKFALVIGSLK